MNQTGPETNASPEPEKSHWLRNILLGLAAVILILVVVVSLQPAAFRISRSTTIAAPPATVFAQVNDFRNWEAWSPWAKLDPNAQFTYEGAESGVGAMFRWDGNADVGAGSMRITESKPDERILIDLQFLKPFAARNVTEFMFEPQGEGTVVTWTMSGTHDFFGKAFSLFADMDQLVGGDFERGLASMKSVAEAANHGAARPDGD